jgi:hypothetical protein
MLINDAIKIGIPSIVAIAGIISTYLLTKSGHKKDLIIESLRATHETQKEINTRTGDLIRNITISLSRLHHTMLLYANHLFAKVDMEKDGLRFPERNRKELSAQYQAFVDILHDSFSIEAQVFLLGRKDVDEKFTKYQSALTELSMNFVPSIGPDMHVNVLSPPPTRAEFFSSFPPSDSHRAHRSCGSRDGRESARPPGCAPPRWPRPAPRAVCDAPGDVFIRHHAPRRNAQQRLPHLDLEIRPGHVQIDLR